MTDEHQQGGDAAPSAPPDLSPALGRAWVEIGAGELLDRLTILRLKRVHVKAEAALANVERERAALEETRAVVAPADDPEVARLEAELAEVNARLWDIEDALRRHEAAGRFDAAFVALARAVYLTNDKRAAIKKAINLRCGARMVEEKAYAAYAPSTAPARGAPSKETSIG